MSIHSLSAFSFFLSFFLIKRSSGSCETIIAKNIIPHPIYSCIERISPKNIQPENNVKTV